MEQQDRVKAYGYIRVSTEEQVDGMSLSNQERAIREYAVRHNLEIVDIFHDDGYSAKTANRPALQMMLKDLTQRDCTVKAVVVYNTSRISRDLESFTRDISYYLSAQGVRLHSSSENIDDTPEGKLMKNITLSIHQYDNDIKSRTVKDNMRMVSLEGWWVGSIPTGYVKVKVPIGEKSNDGKVKTRLTLAPDTTNDMGNKIRLILERFSKGDLAQSELAQFAFELGVTGRSGDVLHPQSINNFIKNAVYAGYNKNEMTDNELVKAKHEGLISLDTYLRNQAILAGRKPSEIDSKPRFTAEYPLKHSLLCVNCHKPLTGSAPTTGAGGRSPRYHCTRCTGFGSISIEEAHDLFEAMLKDVTPTDGMMRLFSVVTRRIANERLVDLNKNLADLRAQVSKIDEDINKALQAFLDGQISKEEKEDYQQSLRLKRVDLDMQINALEDAQRLNESTIDYVCNFANLPAKMWLDAEPAIKVEFQKMITTDGIEFDIKARKFGTSGLSPLYRLKSTQKDAEAPSDSIMVIPRRIELRLPG
ncbi:MAG: recombinase family protein [Candidatus Saccharimonadota bacterium]